MAKAWLMQGRGIAPYRVRAMLAESHECFERHLTELHRHAPNDETQRALVALECVCGDYRAVLVML